MPQTRLQKFLADAGIASRRAAEVLITDGKISVNGEVVKKLGTTVDPAHDTVAYLGKIVQPVTGKTYLALHKPAGYITSASEGQGPSVLSLVKTKMRLFPVGRLDKDSTGLLLLTNDGEFGLRVSHARFGCEKEYFVTLDRDLHDQDKRKLERGIKVGPDFLSGVKVISAQNKSVRLILKRGANRQIRRMLGRMGYNVGRLKRVRIGKLQLGTLAEGQSRAIKPTDVL